MMDLPGVIDSFAPPSFWGETDAFKNDVNKGEE